MQISTPIYRLKRQAKLLARQDGLPLHQALDKIAATEGYRSWSHLAAAPRHQTPAQSILAQLVAGQLCLLGARPQQGKTRLGLEVAALAPAVGRRGYFFTLEYHEADISDRFAAMGTTHSRDAMVIDTSDDISAQHIIDRVTTHPEPALIVVDYLQLLDQKRRNPSLEVQMSALRSYAVRTGAVCVVISQIDRMFDLSGKTMPDRGDIRLPNPLDLSVFSRFVFLHNGALSVERAA